MAAFFFARSLSELAGGKNSQSDLAAPSHSAGNPAFRPGWEKGFYRQDAKKVVAELASSAPRRDRKRSEE